MKKAINAYIYLLSIAGAIVLVDQVTKSLVRANLALGETWSPWDWLAPYARIVHWQNTGAVFGIFQGFGDVFMVLSIVVALAILYYFPQVPKEEWPLRIAMGLQLGGATGNLIDRITQGHVTDFISVGNFAVFNVADSCISVGVAVLILGVWIKELQQKRQTPEGGEPVENREPDQPEPDPANEQDQDEAGKLPAVKMREESLGE